MSVMYMLDKTDSAEQADRRLIGQMGMRAMREAQMLEFLSEQEQEEAELLSGPREPSDWINAEDTISEPSFEFARVSKEARNLHRDEEAEVWDDVERAEHAADVSWSKYRYESGDIKSHSMGPMTVAEEQQVAADHLLFNISTMDELYRAINTLIAWGVDVGDDKLERAEKRARAVEWRLAYDKRQAKLEAEEACAVREKLALAKHVKKVTFPVFMRHPDGARGVADNDYRLKELKARGFVEVPKPATQSELRAA